MILCDMIWYVCQLQLGSHPVAAVQYTLTHKEYTENTIIWYDIMWYDTIWYVC